ncbi:hypothetical protein AB0D29_38200 [Streptomyces sp. NPDC048424]|uniref:hypothetical protein n=1 Tax=Streptomyces sp. NPDC048424 TaxID=3155265 RepID=UPI003435F502
MTSPNAWPKGVVARYLTRAAEILSDPNATVDVRRNRDYGHSWDCRGCGHGTSSGDSNEVHTRAQAHAEKCRAIPRPTCTDGSQQ